MATTQAELAQQMIQQLRVLDPAISAEIGTPERKIIDTVAQALAETQIDLNVLSGAFDLEAKFGADLDRFLAIFGFGRQQGSQATGYIKFSRETTSLYDIPIPRATQVIAPASTDDALRPTITFQTTENATLKAGDLDIVVPVRALTVGVSGNLATGLVSEFGSTPVLGITGVTNEIPTTGGIDPETDDEFKVRFKNTVFRNLSGTHDQYLALAVATLFTTKANVVGPISRYREYIQVPAVDDSTLDPSSGISGNGTPGQWTSALSTIPYSKHTYDTIPYYITSGLALPGFYRSDVDFQINTTDLAKDRGDTYRERTEGAGLNPSTDSAAFFQPNITFFDVYTGTDEDVQALRPSDVVLFEHSYMSTASRNDWDRQITNCVDVFINGLSAIPAEMIVPRPSGTVNIFNAVTDSRFYVENFRRIGVPDQRPTLGNLFMGTFWQPMADVPDLIRTSDATYYKDIHYYAVEDISLLKGTVRARNGIEWAIGVNGQAQSDAAEGPYTGPKITGTDDTAIDVDGYTYDRNIVDLQIAMDGAKQVTTDALAHQGVRRYFKLDLTVMYTSGSSIPDVNLFVQTQVANFLAGQYFGTTIQLSDILQIVHSTPGVDNVRWSKEILDAQSRSTDNLGDPRHRVVECDEDGNPRLNVFVDRRVGGNAGTPEVQQIYLTPGISAGTYTLTLGNATTASIAYNASAGTVQTALTNAGVATTITGSGTPTSPFLVAFTGNGQRALLTPTTDFTGGSFYYNSDFFLHDDELPTLPSSAVAGDTLAGLILRPRAQNTWNQL